MTTTFPVVGEVNEEAKQAVPSPKAFTTVVTAAPLINEASPATVSSVAHTDKEKC